MKTFAGRKLGRTSSHRRALLSHLVTDLLQNEKIKTTFPKAKEAARYAEKVITSAKQGGVTGQRAVAKQINLKITRKKLFEVLVPRYQSREGGYTQITRVGQRSGDAAPMAVIRLVS